MIKKILLSIASFFLVWQSYHLLYIAFNLQTDSWSTIAIIAFLINLFITGIFAFAGFAFPTEDLFPKVYYKIHRAKLLKKVYKILQVEWFRKFLLATFWRSQKQRSKYFNGKKDGIDNLEQQSKKSEFGHLLPFIVIDLIAIYLISIGSLTMAFLTLLINVIGNFYPILLQRYHRMRIEILRRRQASRSV